MFDRWKDQRRGGRKKKRHFGMMNHFYPCWIVLCYCCLLIVSLAESSIRVQVQETLSTTTNSQEASTKHGKVLLPVDEKESQASMVKSMVKKKNVTKDATHYPKMIVKPIDELTKEELNERKQRQESRKRHLMSQDERRRRRNLVVSSTNDERFVFLPPKSDNITTTATKTSEESGLTDATDFLYYYLQEPHRLQSHYSIYIGSCAITSSTTTKENSLLFHFPLSSGSGQGMAIFVGSATNNNVSGSITTAKEPITVTLDDTSRADGTLEVDNEIHIDPLTFGFGNDDYDNILTNFDDTAVLSSWGSRFSYDNIGQDGGSAYVQCPNMEQEEQHASSEWDVIVLIRDSSDMVVEAHYYGDPLTNELYVDLLTKDTGSGIDGGENHSYRMINNGGAKTDHPTKSTSFSKSIREVDIPSPKSKKTKTTSGRRLTKETPLSIVKSSPTSIVMKPKRSLTNIGSTFEEHRQHHRLLKMTKKNNSIDTTADENNEDDDTQLVLIQVELNGSDTKETIYRTLIANASKSNRRRLTTPMIVASTTATKGDGAYGRSKVLSIEPFELTEDHDILLKISGLDRILSNFTNDSIHVTLELGIHICSTTLNAIASAAEDCTIVMVLDLSAIVPMDAPELMLHGDWIRQSLHRQNASSTNNWELVIRSIEIVDVDHPLTILAYSNIVQSPGFSMQTFGTHSKQYRSTNNVMSHRERALQVFLPSSEEDDELLVSNEMRYGRKPSGFVKEKNVITRRRRLRGLAEEEADAKKNKKILVHGYCANQSPFPSEHFTNALHFQDPEDKTSSFKNWSNNMFAKKIRQYTLDNDVKQCSCIAHSQGGLACLHLHTYYWSCLDRAWESFQEATNSTNVTDNQDNKGTRLMQSIGTPYKGTLLSQLADVGNIFGFACSSNVDLTYDGAMANLRNYPSIIQSRMYYYTSSFKERRFRIDYCHAATDLFLDDPDDGVTEQWKGGPLPYGNSAGHIKGQCHTKNMKYEAQAQDNVRNQEMNLKSMF